MPNGSVDFRANYRRRVLDSELDLLLPSLAAIAIEGAKGVGKTETALQRAATVYRLDDDDQRSIASADPQMLVQGDRPILIDEWQRFPEAWDVVRRGVDRDLTGGQWILTGSAAPLAQPTHSGAGRIVTLQMRPLTLPERGVGVPTVSLSELLDGSRPDVNGTTHVALTDYVREVTASGFPGLRHLDGRALEIQLDGYITRVIERDFKDEGG